MITNFNNYSLSTSCNSPPPVTSSSSFLSPPSEELKELMNDFNLNTIKQVNNEILKLKNDLKENISKNSKKIILQQIKLFEDNLEVIEFYYPENNVHHHPQEQQEQEQEQEQDSDDDDDNYNYNYDNMNDNKKQFHSIESKIIHSANQDNFNDQQYPTNFNPPQPPDSNFINAEENDIGIDHLKKQYQNEEESPITKNTNMMESVKSGTEILFNKIKPKNLNIETQTYGNKNKNNLHSNYNQCEQSEFNHKHISQNKNHQVSSNQKKKQTELPAYAEHDFSLINNFPSVSNGLAQIRFFVTPPSSPIHDLKQIECVVHFYKKAEKKWTEPRDLMAISESGVFASDWLGVNSLKIDSIEYHYIFKYKNIKINTGLVKSIKISTGIVFNSVDIYTQMLNRDNSRFTFPSFCQQLFSFFHLLSKANNPRTWNSTFENYYTSLYRIHNQIRSIEAVEFFPLLQQLYQTTGDMIIETVISLLSFFDHLIIFNQYSIVADVTKNIILSANSRIKEIRNPSININVIISGIENCVKYNLHAGDYSYLLLAPFYEQHIKLNKKDKVLYSPSIEFCEDRYKLFYSSLDLYRNSSFLLTVLNEAPSKNLRNQVLNTWKHYLCEMFSDRSVTVKEFLEGLALEDLKIIGDMGFPTDNVSDDNGNSLRQFYFELCSNHIYIEIQNDLSQYSSSNSKIISYLLTSNVIQIKLNEILSSIDFDNKNEVLHLYNLLLSSYECKWLALNVLFHEKSLVHFLQQPHDLANAFSNWIKFNLNDDIITILSRCYYTLNLMNQSSKAKLLHFENLSNKIIEETKHTLKQQSDVIFLKSIKNFSILFEKLNKTQIKSTIYSLYTSEWSIYLNQYIVNNSWCDILQNLELSALEPNCVQHLLIEFCFQNILNEFANYCKNFVNDELFLIELCKQQISKFLLEISTKIKNFNLSFDYPILNRISRLLRFFSNDLRNKNLRIGLIIKLKDIERFPESIFNLFEFLDLIDLTNNKDDNIILLTNAIEDVEIYKKTVYLLQSFLSYNFTGSIFETDFKWKANNIEEYQIMITNIINSIDETILSVASSVSYLKKQHEDHNILSLNIIIWESQELNSLLFSTIRYSSLHQSPLFRAAVSLAVQEMINNTENSLTVQSICEMVFSNAIRNIERLFLSFSKPTDIYLSEILPYTFGLNIDIVDKELELLSPFLQILHLIQISEISYALSKFLRANDVFILSNAILKLGEIFKCPDTNNFELKEINEVCNFKNYKDTTLQKLDSYIFKFDQIIDNIKSADILFLELSQAESLISFAKDVSGETNFNLIDSVEDFGESSIRVEVVSDFDMIRSLLKEPLKLLREDLQQMNLIELLTHIKNESHIIESDYHLHKNNYQNIISNSISTNLNKKKK